MQRHALGPRGYALGPRRFARVPREPPFDRQPHQPHSIREGETDVPIVAHLPARFLRGIKPCLPDEELQVAGSVLLLEADPERIKEIQTSFGINLDLGAARELIQKRKEAMIYEAYLRDLHILLGPVFQLITTALPRRLALGFTNEQHDFFRKSFNAIPGDKYSGYHYGNDGSDLSVNIMALANPLGFVGKSDPLMRPKTLRLDCFGDSTNNGQVDDIFLSFDPIEVKSVSVSFTIFHSFPIPWRNFGGLHTLRLPCCFIDTEALSPLCDVLKGCKGTLKSFDISGNSIFSVPEGWSEHEKFFSVLGDCSGLEKLNLDDNGGISAGFFESGLAQDLFGALRKLEKLRTLSLAYFISAEIDGSSNLQIFLDLICAIPKSVVDFDYSYNTVWPLDKTHDAEPLVSKEQNLAWEELLGRLHRLSFRHCVLMDDAWDQLRSLLTGWQGHHLDLSHMRCSDRVKTSLAFSMDLFKDSAEQPREIRSVKVDFSTGDIGRDQERPILRLLTSPSLPYLGRFNLLFSSPRPSDRFLDAIDGHQLRHREVVKRILALCFAHRESDHSLAMLPQDILRSIQFLCLISKCDDIRPAPAPVVLYNPLGEAGSGSEWAQQQQQDQVTVAADDMDDSQPRGTKRGLAEDTDQHPAATATAESEAEEGEKSDDLEPANKRART